MQKTPMTGPDYVKQALGALEETGPVPRDGVATLWEFSEYLVNLLEDEGFDWRGHSFKNREWSVLMVMKVTREKHNLVCFTTERTTRGCMRVFLRKMRDGTLAWVNDKFA